ncbi:MAG TPA: carbohydrate porin, partial [Burkholderiaceae bacterium]|nr:carbohydrate porin [Burkholderiaceae bacterium]
MASARAAEDWNAKLQSTYTWQTKPGLSSPYQGEHSLSGEREKSYSFTATAAFGLRLGPKTEAYLDPEVSQGVPLSGLVGLAGFTNGEMARTSGSNPTLYRARVFVRHVIALGDETEEIEPAMNQLGSIYAKHRLTLTAGNVSVLDLFDANQFNHDPRTQFLNWTVMTHGAYDFAADARGYTWGVAAEYQGDNWALRAGRFIQPKEPNQLPLDPHILRHYGDQIEFERRYALSPEQPGTVRLLAYRNRALMARYDDALARADATGTAPSLDAVRTTEHSKVGVGVNLEQSVTQSLGVFARAMWADGQTETYAFTEADRSASAGLSTRGNAWGRGEDTLGLALAENFLSAPHRQVLARGGITFFLGDGRLNYRPEQIAEAYYAWAVTKGITLSFDVQYIRNPGYNADRGPVSFYALRLHVEN